MCTVKDSNYGISFVQPLVHSSQSAQSQSSQSQSQPQSQPSQAESDFLLFWDAKAVQKIVEEGIEHEKKFVIYETRVIVIEGLLWHRKNDMQNLSRTNIDTVR